MGGAAIDATGIFFILFFLDIYLLFFLIQNDLILINSKK